MAEEKNSPVGVVVLIIIILVALFFIIRQAMPGRTEVSPVMPEMPEEMLPSIPEDVPGEFSVE